MSTFVHFSSTNDFTAALHAMASTSPPAAPHTIAPVRLPNSSARRTVDARPRLGLLHPGYGLRNNRLLSLPAVDSFNVAGPGASRPGLHHRTLLTAGAIIANNAFDRAYLSCDQAGRVRVEVPLDGILEPGDYWLQLEGHESLIADAHSAVPPPPSRPSSPSRSPSTLGAQTSTSPPSHCQPYPVVPSFRDWEFPHDTLPAEWKRSGFALAPASPLACCVTRFGMARHKCDLIPSNQQAWFASNDMRQYARSLPGRTDDPANLVYMRADVHMLFDQHRFAIIPKPSAFSATSSPWTQEYAFAVHILKDDEESGELCDYHNAAIQPSGSYKPSHEFLFARFAWSLFSHVQPFLESSRKRYLAVRSDTEARHTPEWLDHKQWNAYQARRGDSRDGSRKRSVSRISRDNADGYDDAYEERRGRRRSSWRSANLSRDLNENTEWFDEEQSSACGADLEMEQIDRNTRWYEEVGRHAGGDLETEQIDENTRWYEKVGRFALKTADGDVDDTDSDPRGRSPPSEGFDDTPNLSRSGTTHRSSLLEVEEEYRPPSIDGDASHDKVIQADLEAEHLRTLGTAPPDAVPP